MCNARYCCCISEPPQCLTLIAKSLDKVWFPSCSFQSLGSNTVEKKLDTPTPKHKHTHKCYSILYLLFSKIFKDYCNSQLNLLFFAQYAQFLQFVFHWIKFLGFWQSFSSRTLIYIMAIQYRSDLKVIILGAK